jgi:hypothetical protein
MKVRKRTAEKRKSKRSMQEAMLRSKKVATQARNSLKTLKITSLLQSKFSKISYHRLFSQEPTREQLWSPIF